MPDDQINSQDRHLSQEISTKCGQATRPRETGNEMV